MNCGCFLPLWQKASDLILFCMNAKENAKAHHHLVGRGFTPAAVTRTPSAETLPSAPLRGSTALRSAQNDTADGDGFPSGEGDCFAAGKMVDEEIAHR